MNNYEVRRGHRPCLFCFSSGAPIRLGWIQNSRPPRCIEELELVSQPHSKDHGCQFQIVFGANGVRSKMLQPENRAYPQHGKSSKDESGRLSRSYTNVGPAQSQRTSNSLFCCFDFRQTISHSQRPNRLSHSPGSGGSGCMFGCQLPIYFIYLF